MNAQHALASLAWTQRRLAWQYRKWAAEDEARGALASYRKNSAEAERLLREARWHIDYARTLTWH